jgi:hypothetical protein
LVVEDVGKNYIRFFVTAVGIVLVRLEVVE